MAHTVLNRMRYAPLCHNPYTRYWLLGSKARALAILLGQPKLYVLSVSKARLHMLKTRHMSGLLTQSLHIRPHSTPSPSDRSPSDTKKHKPIHVAHTLDPKLSASCDPICALSLCLGLGLWLGLRFSWTFISGRMLIMQFVAQVCVCPRTSMHAHLYVHACTDTHARRVTKGSVWV